MSDGATIDYQLANAIVGGHQLTGRPQGQWVSIVYDDDAYALTVGIDGEGLWVHSGSRSATITLSCLQSSVSNTILAGFHELDRATPGGVMQPFLMNEQNGATFYSALRARIIKHADGVWSNGAEVRTWTLRTSNLVGFPGGVGTTPTA